MQDNYSLSDEEAVERPADPGAPARAQLEQAIPERARVRQPKAGAMLCQKFDQSGVVGKNINRP